MSVSFDSPWYPYEKVLTGAQTMKGAETIPYKVLQYLLDLPDASGYAPVDDNERPRVRLAKYLWYDGADPLSQPLPTPEQKRSLLFDPYDPVLNTDEDKAKHPQGYRLYWQRIYGQAQLEAMTTLKCYVAHIFEQPQFISTIGLRFEVMVNVNHETNTKTQAYERSFDIEQCIREALNGVNMAGIGTFMFDRRSHTDNGSGYLWDEATNVGRWLHCSVQWAESNNGLVTDY